MSALLLAELLPVQCGGERGPLEPVVILGDLSGSVAFHFGRCLFKQSGGRASRPGDSD
jgi:hypothetical protein